MREMAFSFDALGRITQRVDFASGHAVVRGYSYDDLDRLIGETKSPQPGITNFTVYSYDDAGRRIAKASTAFDVHYANGAGDRLAGWAVTRTNTPFCTVAGTASESIGTDPRYGVREVSGGIRAVTPAVSGSNFIAQVAFETLGGKSVVASVPDAAGNVGVATNNFVLAAYTAGDYLSDDAGCVTQIVYAGAEDWHERALSWDSEYRLTTVATNGSAAEGYGFDPFGRRIWTASAGVTNWHLYDGPHVLADLDAAGGVLRTYLYGPGIDELVAMTVYTGTVAQTYYAIRDHQNTVWAWVDESGVVVESYDFDAWGRVLEVYDASGAPIDSECSSLGNRYLWQGREYSWQTGLYYFRARWYDPVTGRWLSNDPIGISGGLNQFVFCANDPVNFIDPQANEPLPLDLGEGYSGRTDLIPGPGGLEREHLHVFRNGEEVAKISKEGAWMQSHKGNILLKPSQVPSSVRNRINSVVRKFGRLNLIVLPIYLLDDMDLYLRGREQGRSYREQLEEELRNAGPYVDTWLGPMPNPLSGQGINDCPIDF